MTPMMTATRSRRVTKPSLRQFLRDATPIPGADVVVLGAVVLGTVCTVAEVVQRLTGWSL